jgi:arylsulfatase A-like enzyme
MMNYPKNTLAVVLLLLFIGACTYPFTTATYKWKIKWDKNKLEFKEKYLAQDLPEHSEGKPPNILFIVIDDLGKFEVSAYGSVTMKTPNIDRLASEGVLFTDCYVNSPVCSPSRAGLLTGRYPQRYGFETQPMEMYPNSLVVYAMGKYLMNTGDFVMATKPKFPPEWQIVKQGVPPTEMNLAEILKMRNYNTACIGKWHLGMSKELIPNDRGFDRQYGFYGAFTLYSEHRKSPNMVNYKSDAFSYKHQWKMGRKETSAIRRNDKVIKEGSYLSFALGVVCLSVLAVNMY